ncbi:glycosyltransferase family 4 protein [Gorillibacterium massiliense]|uniref:glycosyltransferase family 4 protein n=1 Tax=Gorillibacterium massiliense TaxID=1280390 RepID=UPI0004BA3F49|nr:glycosyltransferase family 4 protein [Gorillibacterium massiliense]
METGKKLRICMVVGEEIAGPGAIIPGGIGQYTLRYCRMLAEMGHEVTIACYCQKEEFEFREGGIRYAGISGGKLPWGLYVYNWLRTQRFDVIEFPEWGGYGAYAALLLRRKFGRIITRGHGHSLWVQRVHGKPIKKGRQHVMEWLQLHFSTGILANSGFLKDLYLQDFGLRDKAVDICHIGIDRKAIGQEDREKGDYQGPVMIYVGGYDRRKGPVDLIRILQETNLCQDAFKVRLIMVGQDTPTGPNGMSYKEYCMQTARELGVYEQVDFMPATPRQQLAQIYGKASLFVSASRAETLGIPFLEAMSLGLPVVTWRTGAAPELIVDGETGYLLEYGEMSQFAEKAVRIFKDQDLWRAFSENAVRNVSQRFLEADVLDRQVAWYQNICG